MRLRHRETAIPRLVFGNGLQRRRMTMASQKFTRTLTNVSRDEWRGSLMVHPCAFSVLVYQPTVPTYLCLPTYLPTYLYTSFTLAEPRLASIAPICITRTCLSIALPRLASSPRLLPSRTGKRRNEKSPRPPPPPFFTLIAIKYARSHRSHITLHLSSIMFTSVLQRHRGLLP